MADLTTKQVNGWHIADNPELYQPAQVNHFEFIVYDLDGSLRAGADATDPDADDFITNSQETIRLGVNKSFTPHFSQSEISVSKGNTKTYFAGPIEYKSGTVDVIDYIGRSGKSVLMAWQRLSGDSTTGAVGNASQYKKRCSIVEYTPSWEPVRSWTLIGCWILELSEPDFNNESAEKKVVSATIRYDRAIPD